MSKYHVRLTFYGREEFVDFPASAEEFRFFNESAKKLAAGQKNVPSHYLLTVSDTTAALIAVKEVQAVYFLEGDRATRANNIVNGSRQLDIQGIALYLKGRSDPISLRMSGSGPIDDMIAGLTSTGYTEEGFECVMLADDDHGSIFFVLDEVQYALVSRNLLGPPAGKA